MILDIENCSVFFVFKSFCHENQVTKQGLSFVEKSHKEKYNINIEEIAMNL